MKQKLFDREQSFKWATLAILFLGFILQGWLWLQGAPPDILKPAPTGIEIRTVEQGSPEARWLGDQIQLLEPAAEFVREGTLPAWSKRSSGGGFIPGGLLPFLIGAPLIVVPDYKSASFVLILADLLAVLLLVHVMVSARGWRFAAIFLSIFWLSPWRLFHSGFLWEPAFLFLPAAAHLWASWRQRESASLGSSFVLGWVLSSVIQLHLSGFILWLGTAFLYASRSLRIRVVGLLAGLGVGGLTLIPLIGSLIQGDPLRLPSTDDSAEIYWVEAPLRILRAAIYWLRLGSGDLGRRLTESSSRFFEMESMTDFVFLASALTAIVACVANFSVWRQSGQSHFSSDQRFLARYSGFMLTSMLVAAMLSPVSPQGWHLLIVLVAACVPIAIWIDSPRLPRSSWVRTLIIVFVFLRIPIILLVGSRHPFYSM